MMFRIVMLWILGGLLIIPYSIHRLFFYADRDEYAFLIVMPLFWIFGFWGVVGPMIAALRIHRIMKALESAGDADQVREAFERHEGKEVIIDLIALENKLPRFLAVAIYKKIVRKLALAGADQQLAGRD
ncbi:MAG TPA: hypothetical protein VF268_03595 [Gammaproteobacteria bacterium]